MSDRILIREAEMREANILSNEVVDKLRDLGFFTQLASLRYHGSHKGGLYDHSRCLYKYLNEFTHKGLCTWKRPESPYIISMFHDLCKLDSYVEIPGAPDEYEYNKDQLLKGHAIKSVMIASTLMQLTEQEMLCIRYHMGAYDKDDWEGFDKAIRKYPEVLYTHTADMLASKVDNV